jgi:hypothetical protein
MGLNLVLFSLSRREPVSDQRFDSLRRAEDYALSAWLNDSNAIYRYFGDPHQLDKLRPNIDLSSAREWVEANFDSEREREREFAILKALGSDEQFSQITAGAPTDVNLRTLWSGQIYERPKSLTEARKWAQTVVIPYAPVGWNRERFLNLLDLLATDEDLWIYEDE